ncbi:DUF5615 family PIN-like protein [Acidithiobacillus ferrivorans]
MLETGFPGSSHVVLLGLERAGDHDIWIYAQQNDFVIVTRDSDFSDMTALYGPPPKVVRFCRGNCHRKVVAQALIEHREEILHALSEAGRGLVEIL